MCETRITVYGKDIFIHIELQSIQIVMDDLIVDINAYDKSVSVNFDPIKKVTIYHDYIDIIDELYKLYPDIIHYYDFSNIDYKSSKKPVKIVCKFHGEFERLPEVLLYGHQVCHKCATESEFPVEFEYHHQACF